MFTLTINSDLKEVAQVAETIHTFCLKQGCSEDIAFQIEVCVVEAINNSIIHSYHNKMGHSIDILYAYKKNNLYFEISDYGEAISEIPTDIPDAMDVGGRGWFIMRQWMDNVEYHRIENCNKVCLTRNINNINKKS